MQPHGDQCRCSCGAMFARVVREGLEIKCRKCKSIVLITHDELVEMYRSLDFDPPPPLAGR
jgi:phage FluMu protein Com